MIKNIANLGYSGLTFQKKEKGPDGLVGNTKLGRLKPDHEGRRKQEQLEDQQGTARTSFDSYHPVDHRKSNKGKKNHSGKMHK